MQPPMPPLDDESPTIPSLSGLPSLSNLPSRRDQPLRPTAPPMQGQGRRPTAPPEAAHVVVGIGDDSWEGDLAQLAPGEETSVLGSRLSPYATRKLDDPPRRSRRSLLLLLLVVGLALICGLGVLADSLIPGFSGELSGGLGPGLAAAASTDTPGGTPLATLDNTGPVGQGPGAPTAGPGTPKVTIATATAVRATVTVGGGGSGSDATATTTTSGPPAPTATNAPLAPQLSVGSSGGTVNCLLGSWPTLTVSNSGGGNLSWSATTSDENFVTATPSSGSLAAGAQKTVKLAGILHLGNQLRVTFTSNGGGATVTISC